MEPILAQSPSSSTGFNWVLLLKFGAFVLVPIIASIIKKLKEKAAERSVEKQKSSARAAAELEAIRTGRGIEQVLSQSPVAGTSFPSEGVPLPVSDDPKARRERQLAELRRRAAARGGQASVQSAPLPRSTARQLPMPTPSQPMPQLVRQPSPSQPIQVQLPGGGTVSVGRGQSQSQRQVSRPQAKPVPQKQRSQNMSNEQAARAARERQAVPTRVQNTQVSDAAGSSDTHRLVADTDAAKVTARTARKGPKLGRAGLRQAILMSEIFGKPRSERLDEI